MRTGPVKPEATKAVTWTGEVRVALLSGAEDTDGNKQNDAKHEVLADTALSRCRG